MCINKSKVKRFGSISGDVLPRSRGRVACNVSTGGKTTTQGIIINGNKTNPNPFPETE